MTAGKLSADELAKAMAVEAQRFKNEPHRAQDWVIGEMHAERLASWAEDVRQLAADQAQLFENMRLQRNALAHWEDAAQELRAILAREGLSISEMLVQISARLDPKVNPPWSTTGTQSSAAKLERVREIAENAIGVSGEYVGEQICEVLDA